MTKLCLAGNFIVCGNLKKLVRLLESEWIDRDKSCADFI